MIRSSFRFIAVLLASALVFAGTANAMSIREFRTIEKTEKNGKNYVQYYLVGLLEGIRESNDITVRNGGKPIFCIDGRKMEPSSASPLFQAELKRNHDTYEADMPVQLVMSNALKNTYPCSP